MDSIGAARKQSNRIRALTRIGSGLLPVLVFLALAIWSMRNVLATPGIIGHSWDWGIQAFAEQNLAQAQSTFWIWDDLIGGGTFNPLKSFPNFFILFPLGTLGGEVNSKSLVVLLPWASAIGMYLLVRKGLGLNSFWATIAGALYMLSPITYSRLVSGYLNLILAQALLPVLILLCLQIPQVAERGSRSLAWKVVAAGVILGVSQASHSSIFILAPLSAAVVLGLGITRCNAKKTVVSAAAVFFLGLLLNISWIMSFGINYVSAGSLFHGGGSEKPTDQITLASVTDWRQGMLDSISEPTDDAIRLYGANGVATEIEFLIPDALASEWLVVSFLLPLCVFALLLSRRALTPGVLALVLLGLIGVAMVSGTRTVIGASVYQFFKAFAPPAWAEFGNTTRAFPLVALSYCALAPLGLQRLSQRRIDWMSSRQLPVLSRRVLAVTLGTLLFAALAIWCAPFLSGDITQSSDKALGLNFYTVQPEDRAVYDFLRANPSDSRMTVIPPSGIWGVSDRDWTWDVGSMSPRPRFLSPNNNSWAWRAASDFRVLSPNSRAGKLLGLAAVEYVVFPFARNFDEGNRAQYAAALAAQPDLKPAAVSFAGTTILENQGYLPRVYAASVATMILGSSDLLAPLSTTPWIDNKPALFFSTQQPTQDLDAIAARAAQFIAPFQTYTVTPSSLIATPLGFAYRPVSIETRQVRGLGDFATRAASFGDTAVASAGIFSVTHNSEYVVRLRAYAPASKPVTMGQSVFAKLDDALSETPTGINWKAAPASRGSEQYTWTTNTLFDKRVTGQGALEVRALLRDSSNADGWVEFTRALKPFSLGDYPILQVGSQAQDPGVQLVEVHLGLDWDGDGVADDNWLLPIVPRVDSTQSQFAVGDFVKLDFPNKPEYRVVSVTVRLRRRPKIDQQRVQSGLYSFGLTEISFRASSQANAKSIPFLPVDATSSSSAADSPTDSGVTVVSKPAGLAITFPVGDRDTAAIVERALQDVNTQEYPIYSLAYQADGGETFALDLQISGLDSSGALRTLPLGTRLLEPFSRGTLVFTAPQFALGEARAQVTLSKLVGSQELRAASVTLSQFRVSRQTLASYQTAQPTAPFVSIDGAHIPLLPLPASGDRTGAWFTSQPLELAEGSHSILSGYDDSTAPYRVGLVEIAPTQVQQPSHAAQPPSITFRQINPTRYLVHVDNAVAPFFLVFSESFHAGWQAYVQQGANTLDSTWYEQSALSSWLLDSSKRTEISQHNLVNGYANSWYVQEKGSYDIILEFTPQRLYEAGVFVIVSTPMVCFVLLATLELRRRKLRGSS